jgi:hypothetical protein
MKNSNDIIGNRTRDLPACTAVPQPTAPPCAPFRNQTETQILPASLKDLRFFSKSNYSSIFQSLSYPLSFLARTRYKNTVPTRFDYRLLSAALSDMRIGRQSDFSQSRCQLYCTSEARSIITMFQRLQPKALTSADQTICQQRNILLLVLRLATSHVVIQRPANISANFTLYSPCIFV